MLVITGPTCIPVVKNVDRAQKREQESHSSEGESCRPRSTPHTWYGVRERMTIQSHPHMKPYIHWQCTAEDGSGPLLAHMNGVQMMCGRVRARTRYCYVCETNALPVDD